MMAQSFKSHFYVSRQQIAEPSEQARNVDRHDDGDGDADGDDDVGGERQTFDSAFRKSQSHSGSFPFFKWQKAIIIEISDKLSFNGPNFFASPYQALANEPAKMPLSLQFFL